MSTKAAMCRAEVKNLPLAARSESQLVGAAKRGDRGAFDALLDRHVDSLFWSAFRITRQKEDAEDAVQDSMLRAFLHVRDFDERSRFATWLTRITINSALMILRKKRSAHEVSEEAVLEHNFEAESPHIVETAPNPEQCYAQAQKEELLREGIRRLRPAIRVALEIRELQEHSVKETAKLMGISVPAAKARIFHAKRILRKKLRRRINARPVILRISRFEAPRFVSRSRRSPEAERNAA